nr:NAD-dependent epimerase/dehydratase family protein [uncultured Haemophilus sp.]
MKKILITGANSYIGTNVESWLLKNNYSVSTLDMHNKQWKNQDFSQYDAIFHVAGIAHASKDPSKKDLYYSVNRDLAFEVAQKAKESGIKQFIFMSSILVYGDSSSSERVITSETIPTPTDFYGKSKLQAEILLEQLKDEHFKIAIIRPPMIYGKNSKGNYPKLSKLAQTTFIFPKMKNKRSMLHIDNLCEFIRYIISYELDGIYFPQNKEYVCTSELVKEIANVHNKALYLTSLFNFVLKRLFKLDVIKKLFGNLTYHKEISEYEFNYQVVSFKESILLTEK